MVVEKVITEGQSLQVKYSSVDLPLNTSQVKIQWKRKEDIVPYSYQKTVDVYKKEYRKRYEKFLMNGN